MRAHENRNERLHMLTKILSLITMLCSRLDATTIEDVVECIQNAYDAGRAEGKAMAEAIRMTPEAFASILKALGEGHKIQAIKEYRAITGLGLRESKTYIDSICPLLKGYKWDATREASESYPKTQYDSNGYPY